MLKLGLESGDPAVLKALNKGIDLPTAAAALKNLKSAGIAAYLYLLFGTPAETMEAARRTLAFTADHAEEIGFLNLAIFNLPAWGADGERLDAGEYEGDLSLYRPFSHPQGWNRGEVRRFLEREFKRDPAIAPILRRDPPFFTSNHAPFFAQGMAGRKGRPLKNAPSLSFPPPRKRGQDDELPRLERNSKVSRGGRQQGGFSYNPKGRSR
jgi:radical SAM superfamily enzyme YgiQ (UPF0313 family)